MAIQRTITGNYTLEFNVIFTWLNNNNLILDCDTSAGPITINLPEISDFWGINDFRICINDSGKMAGTNNITIVPGGSDEINGNATPIVINVDETVANMNIAGNDTWGYDDATGGGGSSAIPYGVSLGTDTYTVTTSPVFTGAPVAGQTVHVKFGNANTGASTLNANTGGAFPVFTSQGAPVGAGEITTNEVMELVFDGTNWVLIGTVVITPSWALNGNTVGSLKWLGTIDNFDLPIRVFNSERARFKKTGMDLTPTWNSGGTAFTALNIDVVDTASDPASLLFSAGVAGTPVIVMSKNGSFGNYSGGFQWDGPNGEAKMYSSANHTNLSLLNYSSVGLLSTNPALFIQGTWNTTGDPALISVDLTNTASAAAARLIDLKVGGVSVWNVDVAGKTGIGIATPAFQLDVSGSIHSTNVIQSDNYFLAQTTGIAQIKLNSTGTAYGSIDNNSADLWSLGYLTGGSLGTPVLSWNVAGNVGIGVLTNPITARVHIVGSGSSSATVAMQIQDSIANNIWTWKDDGKLYINGKAALWDNVGTYLEVGSGFTYVDMDGPTAVYIRQVRTDSIHSETNVGTNYLSMVDSWAFTSKGESAVPKDAYVFNTNAAYIIAGSYIARFQNAGTDYLVVDKDGKVGVGIGTAPTKEFEVNGDITIVGGGVLYMKDSAAPNNYWAGTLTAGVLVWTDTGSPLKP